MTEAKLSTATTNAPLPAEDWMEQHELAEIFGVTPKTASLRAAAGKLRRYEHGIPNCGRRKYSRQLVLDDIENHWREAVSRLAEESAAPGV